MSFLLVGWCRRRLQKLVVKCCDSLFGFRAFLGFGNHVFYYRDRYGQKGDLVFYLDEGRYTLIKCKLGSREFEGGTKHLLEIKRLIQECNKEKSKCYNLHVS